MIKSLAAFVALAALGVGVQPAFAIDKIYSPLVVQGEAEIEYFGARTFDDDGAKNNIQAHQFSVGYGVTDWWQPEFYGIVEKGAGESNRLTGVELENRFQFSQPGEHWIDSGLLVAYTRALHKGEADDLEVKLLLEKQWGQFLVRANIGFSQAVGPNAEGGPDRVILIGSRYRYSRYFEPGFEIQSDFGVANETHGFEQQEHFIGPAAYGQIVPNLKYEAAYLFGVTKAASQGAMRFQLEYEMFF